MTDKDESPREEAAEAAAAAAATDATAPAQPKDPEQSIASLKEQIRHLKKMVAAATGSMPEAASVASALQEQANAAARAAGLSQAAPRSPEPKAAAAASPAPQSPAPQNPVQQSPAPQNPAQQSPVQQSPVQQSPVQQSPTQQSPEPLPIDWSSEPLPVHANGAQVMHQPTEFAVLYTEGMPFPGRHSPTGKAGDERAIVVSSVRMTPDAFFQTLYAMASSWNRFALNVIDPRMRQPRFKLLDAGELQLEGIQKD